MQSKIGELEEKVMKVLWESKKPLKVSEVKESIKPKLAHTTIMTVMDRLYKKGFLKRLKENNYFTYRVKTSKKEFVEKNFGQVINEFVASYGELAISQFADAVKDDQEAIELLKKKLNLK